jgi:hypothetical protein
MDSFVIRARRGQVLDVRIQGVRESSIVARVTDARSGTPLDARAAEGTRVWVGRVAATADYRIDVVGRRALGPSPMRYTLVIALRE